MNLAQHKAALIDGLNLIHAQNLGANPSAEDLKYAQCFLSAVACLVDELGEAMYGDLKLSAHCFIGSTKLGRLVHDKWTEELFPSFEDAIDAAYQHENDAAYDARFAARQRVLEAAE